MRFVRQLVATLIVVALLTVVMLVLTGRGGSADRPWTPLDPGDGIGLFTGRKLAALGDDPARCRALLDTAGVRHVALPPVSKGACGYDDAVRLAGGAQAIDYSPSGLGTACPVAAGLAMWEWNVVQPAALRHFGQAVERIDHYGSYSCRRIYGRSTGTMSEHATANAVDIAGFRLADGQRVTVVNDWSGEDKAAAFLRDVRDGACKLFATTLSPDYNKAHRDHFHLDQAARGAVGGRVCR